MTWHKNVLQYIRSLVLGIPQCKERNKEKETFQKQTAMLDEVVKLTLALVWLQPVETQPKMG